MDQQNTTTEATTEGSTADAVLADAAATAQPGQEPEIEPQPPELATQQQPTLNVETAQDEIDLRTLQPVVVRSLERARALPEITGDVYAPFECSDPTAILAFKDDDGRTMRVAVTVDGLAKIAVQR